MQLAGRERYSGTVLREMFNTPERNRYFVKGYMILRRVAFLVERGRKKGQTVSVSVTPGARRAITSRMVTIVFQKRFAMVQACLL